MLDHYEKHNLFNESIARFEAQDPHLCALSRLKIQHSAAWWRSLELAMPGLYILTGGRQVGKSTSCKLLIKHCLAKKLFKPQHILYLPCDEVYDAKALSILLRFFLDSISADKFLLIIDEITFVKDWDRVIKALADEGYFQQGLCLLTGSDTLILKEAAMRFPGRRGNAAQTDFHLYPLSFADYVALKSNNKGVSFDVLTRLFQEYLQCGGYLRAINDLAEARKVTTATYQTYEQWIRGDFLKQGKNEETLMAVLQALLTVSVSQVSYSTLTQKIGIISKETCMDYCRLLERMDILFNLQAYDQNKKQGFPRKARKFHLVDPFIYHTISRWLKRERNQTFLYNEGALVEACVASHCNRIARTFYYKGRGEIDVIWLYKQQTQAIEVKWSNQIRPLDLKTIKQFQNAFVLTKKISSGAIDHIQTLAVCDFLNSDFFKTQN